MNLDHASDRARALEVDCSYCGAPVGEPCVRKGTDEPLVNVAAHTCRLDDAGVVHAPLDTRELRRG